MTAPQQVPFDNEVSLLYKWGHYLSTPTKFLLSAPDGRYEPLSSYLTADLARGTSLADIYASLSELLPSLTPFDLAMFYVATETAQGQQLPSLLEPLNVFYAQVNPEGPPGFADPTDLTVKYQAWREQYGQILAREARALALMQDVQAELAQLTPLAASPITFNDAVVQASPVWRDTGRPPTTEQGIDIFNGAQVSYDVPFIQYNPPADLPALEQPKRYKVYRGDSPDRPIDYKQTILSETQTPKSNAIYLNVNTGFGTFLRAVYLLDTNTLTIAGPVTPSQDEQTMVRRVQAALPMLNLGSTREIRMAGEFDIYGLAINEPIFIDMLLNQPLLSTYLYLDESQKDYAEKKRLNIHYKSLTDVQGEDSTGDLEGGKSSLSLIQRQTEPGRVYPLLTVDGSETQGNLPVGTPYVHLNLSRATSRQVAQQMALILRHLFNFYSQGAARTETERLYNQYFPPLPGPVGPVGPAAPVRVQPTPGPIGEKITKGGCKIDQLKEAAPDLFINGYARKCQCALQPVILAPEDVAAWQAQTFVDKGVQHRQVMAFPPVPEGETPTFYFGCPNDDNPYPGVKRNDMPNADKYPYFPCCFKKDQMAPQVTSHYNEYYRGIAKKSRASSKAGHKIRTDKILDLGRIGFVPKILQDFVSRYSPSVMDIVRFGSIRSPNSLIHCALIATSNPTYADLPDDEAKETYARQIRLSMAETLHPSLLQQELYDLTPTEIRTRLADLNLFLDPQLYYRAVEVAFGINIYVLTGSRRPDETNDNNAGLEIPRHRIFHARPPRLNKPTMIIIKHWGAESDALPYPQCELVTDYDTDTESMTKIFGQDMTQLMHTALVTLQRTLTWVPPSPGTTVPQNSPAKVNLYSREDLMVLTQNRATSQFVDDYGKLRGLYLPLESGRLILLAILPAQPENLPTKAPETLKVDEMPTAAEVQPLLGEAKRVTRNDAGAVDGLWFPYLDVETGLYTPIQPSTAPELTAKPLGPPHPLVTTGLDSVSRLRQLQRTMDRLLQLVNYVYILARLETPTITPREFAERYFQIMLTAPADSAKIYDLSAVPRALPRVQTVTAALAVLSQQAPTLFTPNKIIMYNASFADKIQGKLNEYQKLTEGLPLVVPTYLERYYVTASDFTQSPHVAIFGSQQELQTWLRSINRPSYNSLLIQTHLDPTLALQQEPYIYQPGPIFLMQNAPTKEAARSIAYMWATYQLNPGYGATPAVIPDGQGSATLYGIGMGDTLALLEGTGQEGLKLLSYGDDKYAAMLPLAV